MRYFIQACKVMIAAGGALLIASIFHLQYAPTAAIITILSLQSTLYDTLKSIKIRALAFLCGIISAYISYSLFGFTIQGYSSFLFVFTLLSASFRLLDALAINCVIASHYLLSQSISLSLIINEVYLVIIGSFFAFLINLHLHKKHPTLSYFSKTIDKEMKNALKVLSESLHDTSLNLYFSNLKIIIHEAYNECDYIEKNSLKRLDTHFKDYLDMRSKQVSILEKIAFLKNQMTQTYSQTKKVQDLFHIIEKVFDESSDITYLLEVCDKVFDVMKKENLPLTREEFENRALLYTMLLEIESFLKLKEDYLQNKNKVSYF